MGIKINIPIEKKVAVKYQDLDENCEGIIFGKITNIFNGLFFPDLKYSQEAVAGIFVEKWIENGEEIEIKRGVNDVTNIFRNDIILEINEEKN